MNPFDIIIENKKYEYVNNIKYLDKYYVAFCDNDATYIKEYKIVNNEITLYDVNENELPTISEMILK